MGGSHHYGVHLYASRILGQQFSDGGDDAGGNVGSRGRFGCAQELRPVHQDGIGIGAAYVNADEHRGTPSP